MSPKLLKELKTALAAGDLASAKTLTEKLATKRKKTTRKASPGGTSTRVSGKAGAAELPGPAILVPEASPARPAPTTKAGALADKFKIQHGQPKAGDGKSYARKEPIPVGVNVNLFKPTAKMAAKERMFDKRLLATAQVSERERPPSDNSTPIETTCDECDRKYQALPVDVDRVVGGEKMDNVCPKCIRRNVGR
jgi:hypothetical protein